MSFLSKLMFWKKEPELGELSKFGEDFTKDLTGLGKPGFGHEPSYPQSQYQPIYPEPSAFSPQPVQPIPPQQETILSKEMEILSSKLDAIKANIESINQRLANLERLAYGEHEAEHGYKW